MFPETQQVPLKTPTSEALWSHQALEAALLAPDPSTLPAELGVMKLSEAVRLHLPEPLSAIAWDGEEGPGVFVTRNFIETIQEREPAPALSRYLRRMVSTINAKPRTPNPKSENPTLSPQPSALNPRPYTLILKPKP